MSDWIEWKWSIDKPYPEDKDTLIYIKMANGDSDFDESLKPWSVKDWFWDATGEGRITHYRLA